MSHDTCTIDGCERDLRARGYCKAHYTRLMTHGDPLKGGPVAQSTRKCNIEGCDRQHYSRGWCSRHWQRWSRHGDPDVVLRTTVSGTPEERFWPKVDRSGDCWVWTATRDEQGYGRFNADPDVPVGAHRFAYELLVGPIPDGLDLDHLCRNRACVNPDHLEPVTHRENVLRGESPTAVNARKTHCLRGHPFDTSNTRLRPGGRRACRACDAYYGRRRRRSTAA